MRHHLLVVWQLSCTINQILVVLLEGVVDRVELLIFHRVASFYHLRIVFLLLLLLECIIESAVNYLRIVFPLRNRVIQNIVLALYLI